MLTYDEIKDLCKHAGEALAICPVICKRCSKENCPIVDELFLTNEYYKKKRTLEKEEKELQEERTRLEHWANNLEIVLDHYRELDAAYSDNADMVKNTFADFAEALKKGSKKVAEAKEVLKNDFDFITRFLNDRV